MFENCTMQPKVLCKMPGSQSFKAGEVDFSTGGRGGGYKTGHIFPHKVLQMILLQLICQLHRRCASDALKTAQICPETYVLKRLPKLKSICIALWMCMHTAWQEGKSGSLHPALQNCFPELLWVQNLFLVSARCLGFFSLLHN